MHGSLSTDQNRADPGQTRSMIMAGAMPPAAHIVISP
jgi:hypothetical protein